jgi:D-threonate/D-erythronate kinase
MVALSPPGDGGAPFRSEDRVPPPHPAPVVRILADDLTGALDTGAQFTGLIGPVPVSLGAIEGVRSLAFDSATRDEPWAAASVRMRGLDRAFEGADIAYRKIDSLLRGHTLQDIAAGLGAGGRRICVLAPAFPAQDRITRGGIQLFRDRAGAWRPAGPPLPDALRALGVPARLIASPADLEGEGVLVCDAATDGDLAAIAAAGARLAHRSQGTLLWCGSAGLARAVAGLPPPTVRPRLRPVLIVVGSDHAQSRAQIQSFAEAYPAQRVEIAEIAAGLSARVSTVLHVTGAALVSFRLGDSFEPPQMMQRIRAALAKFLPAVERPGGLIVSGGETLRAICEALGADRLMVTGEVRAGIPAAALVGGLWDGLPVLSKSGAFGRPRTLVNLAAAMMSAASNPEIVESGEWK